MSQNDDSAPFSGTTPAPASLLPTVLERIKYINTFEDRKGQKDWSQRVLALRALAQTHTQEEVQQCLLDALYDPHETVRAEAISLLGTLDHPIPREQVQRALHDVSWQVRETMILVYGKKKHVLSWQLLQEALHDPAQPVREAACYALDQSPLDDRTPLPGMFAARDDGLVVFKERSATGQQKEGQHRVIARHGASRPKRTHYSYAVWVSLAAILAIVIGNVFLISHTMSSRPPAPIQPLKYQGPQIIVRGGTYSGNWQSLDPTIPVLKIVTRQPVIIEHANLQGAGNLIQTTSEHANLTIRDSHAYGLNPNKQGQAQGYFIQAWHVDNLLVEHNTIEGTRGILVDTYVGNRNGHNTIKVLYNRADNINGWTSNGAGSYSTGNTQGADWVYASFFEAWDSPAVPGIEIAWNEVIDMPRVSRTSDVVVFNRSGGTAKSPALIHDNYIQGSYSNIAMDSPNAGGITVGQNCAGCAALDFGFVQIYKNQLISIAGNAINIIGGHDEAAYQNRVVTAGRLTDGTRFLDDLGVVLWMEMNDDANFYHDSIHDNTIGVVRYSSPADPQGSRCDEGWGQENQWCQSGQHNDTPLPNPITLATEHAELVLWQQKIVHARIVIGAY